MLSKADELLFLLRTERAETVGVEIHPGYDAVELFGGETDAFVPVRFGQQGVEFTILCDAATDMGAIALESEVMQIVISERQQVSVCVRGGQVRCGGACIVGLRAVASDAGFIEHGLDESVESQGPRAFGSRGQFGRGSHCSEGHAAHGGRLMAMLVTADT